MMARQARRKGGSGVQQNELKRMAGERAAEFIEDGMVIGMGTGSTVYFTIQAVGRRVAQGLRVRAVSTSEETSRLCRELGIPMVSLDEVDAVDVTVDGADEVDPGLDGIKGGHGALLREKIVAINSKRNIWVVDGGKLVPALVRSSVPVEVIPIGWRHVQRRLRERGYKVEVRQEGGGEFLTDGGNHILDLSPGVVADVRALERELKSMVGVVEVGFFLGIVDTVVVARPQGIELVERGEKRP
jgi:ribose 5-phosphate isomerase A